MFCPNCRTEYRQGFTLCSDCGVPLVPQLEPDSEPEYVELVSVFKSNNQADLLIAKSLLEDAGIEYFAKNETAVGFFAQGLGPIELQVRPDDVESSYEVLAAMDEPEDDIPRNLEFED